MIYSFTDPGSGKLYDARIELDGTSVLLHSRGGATGGNPARNTDYEKVLPTILDRLRDADRPSNTTIERVLLDSLVARNQPKDMRTLATSDELSSLSISDSVKLIRQRVKSWGQEPNTKGGNATKALRFEVSGLSPTEIQSALKLSNWTDEHAAPAQKARLPNKQLRKVTPEQVHRSIERILAGADATRFSESTDYDVLLPDGTRLAPKKVFGLALEEALNMEALPHHFSSGFHEPCFQIIEAAGYHIVEKLGQLPTQEEIQVALSNLPPDDSDKEAIEGNLKIVTHMKRERASGLARKKKDAFLREHGELFCERCALRPLASYGAYVGEACIEVHHATTQVKDMLPGHTTKLEDLQCLCANCHRITHREMALGLVGEVKYPAAGS